MLAVHVIGALNYISATEFTEQCLVPFGHSQGAKDSFICGMPGAQCADHESEDFTVFTIGHKVLFEDIVLVDFLGFCGGHCFGVVFEGAADVDYGDTVTFFNYDVRAQSGVGGCDLTIGRDRPKPDSIGEAVYDPVMALSDSYHIGVAVVEDMGQGFFVMAVATGGDSGGPTALVGV